MKRANHIRRHLAAEAGKVYAQILDLADYSGRLGSTWTVTKIRLALGDAVAEAFQAAGGSEAFRNGDPVWTRKAFVASYTEHPPAENPLLRIGSGEVKALPPAQDPRVRELKFPIGNMPRLKDPEENRQAIIDAAAKRANQ